MVVHGEDSLNEHSEELGLEFDGVAEGLNSLRKKLEGKGEGVRLLPDDTGPTREQLIATGELDGENGENGENGEDGENGEGVKTSTALATTEEVSLSIRKQVRKRLLEGATRDELLAEGFNKSTISTVASEVKKETGSRGAVGKSVVTTPKGLPIFAKGSPPEAIIDSIAVPDVADGQGIPFEQGIKFGMSLIILGVRVAQELSGIGITQAKPILDMAKSMREGESMAAKNAAGEAAMEAAGMIQQSFMPILANLQRSGGGEGGGSDPMKNMMVRTMEPIMQKVMGGMLGKLVPGAQAPQLTEGSGQGNIDGWSRRSE